MTSETSMATTAIVVSGTLLLPALPFLGGDSYGFKFTRAILVGRVQTPPACSRQRRAWVRAFVRLPACPPPPRGQTDRESWRPASGNRREFAGAQGGAFAESQSKCYPFFRLWLGLQP